MKPHMKKIVLITAIATRLPVACAPDDVPES